MHHFGTISWWLHSLLCYTKVICCQTQHAPWALHSSYCARSEFQFCHWGIFVKLHWSKTIQFREQILQIPGFSPSPCPATAVQLFPLQALPGFQFHAAWAWHVTVHHLVNFIHSQFMCKFRSYTRVPIFPIQIGQVNPPLNPWKLETLSCYRLFFCKNV